ncbi:Rab3 GTPase-activating protein catalytic subunit [Lunasporangiospora selenospora]|uniref:Rab3 GTPase-activating protein catalytic subunit n=1 Tax=Lunasporangiospora selenospora TaxID=979761 RepID=A0A9P6KHG8_9FUNG|nr:Rab3 GTPase-activating protein catalytic subunit [Lunasporangiospora selenospora]
MSEQDEQDDLESFEFVDYTTSGPWERFIIQIEDALKNWGLVGNGYGVFSPDLMPTTSEDVTSLDHAIAQAIDDDTGFIPSRQRQGSSLSSSVEAAATTATAAAAADTKSQPRMKTLTNLTAGSSTATAPSTSKQEEVYQYSTTVTLDTASYTLSYLYHPAKARIASGVERVDLDFLPTVLEGTEHHILHRWTALTHILVLSPHSPSATTSTTSTANQMPGATTVSSSTAASATSIPTVTVATPSIIDLGTAKLLLSSFAIAFQNTGCNIPVFVPTGHTQTLTYTGFSIQPQLLTTVQRGFDSLGFDEAAEDQAIEVRFNTALVPYPPAQYTSLSGILDLFIERMGIEDEFMDSEEADNIPTLPGNQQPWHPPPTQPGSYETSSYYSGSRANSSGSGNSYSQQFKEQIYVSGLFSYRLDNWYDSDWRDWEVTDKETHDAVRRSNYSTLGDERRLPSGPLQDPLKHLGLIARFASAPSTVYLDSKNLMDMDASQANIWMIKASFSNDEYGLLTGTLEDVISSWRSEVGFLEGGNANRDSGSEKTDQGGYSSLLRKGARLIQGSIAMVDMTDVDQIVEALCTEKKGYSKSTAGTTPSTSKEGTRVDLSQSRRWDRSKERYSHRIISAAELALHFRHLTTVPYNSLLWKLLRHVLGVIAPDSPVAYPTTFMGFLKAVWKELFVRIEDYRSKKILIPHINVFSDRDSDRAQEKKRDGHGQDEAQGEANTDESDQEIAINLRFNLLHQKLSMINCCIVCDAKESRRRKPQDKQQEEAPLASKAETPCGAEEPLTDSDSAASTPPSSGQLTGDADADADSASQEKGDEDRSKDVPQQDASQPISVKTSQSDTELSTDKCASSVNDTSAPDSASVDSSSQGGLLLLETGARLKVPESHGYMTEDMIQEQEELLQSLGPSRDAAKTRAELQSRQLLSDMEAFKAANPGAILADFIRWHSPKDFDEAKRQLSTRMTEPGNIWQELWKIARSVPSSEQDPLFDHFMEAKRAMTYLKNMSSGQIATQLLPTVFLIAYDALVSNPISSASEHVAQELQELAQELTGFPWDELTIMERDVDLKPLLTKFQQVENEIGRVMSLLRKFPNQVNLAQRIMSDSETVVEDGPERECVYNVFSSKGTLQSSFPRPVSREFVVETFDPSSGRTLVTSADLTGWHARPLQRRLYACFRDSEVRIVEAIAKDGMFL